MAVGRRKRLQQALLVATTSLPQWPGHPSYQKPNRLLAEAHGGQPTNLPTRRVLTPDRFDFPSICATIVDAWLWGPVCVYL